MTAFVNTGYWTPGYSTGDDVNTLTGIAISSSIATGSLYTAFDLNGYAIASAVMSGELSVTPAIAFYRTTGASIGGVISTNLVTDVQGSLLPNVSQADALAGITHYACICVKNTTSITINSVGVYIASDVEGSKTYLASGLTGKNSTTEQTIASNITAPTGSIVFQRPLFSYAAINLGTLASGEFYHVWIKRVVTANATGSPLDYFILASVNS